MMCKNFLIHLFIILIAFFSCDDNQEKHPEILPEATYKEHNLTLSLNGNPVNGKKVDFAMSGQGQGILILYDVLPGENEISVQVTLTNKENSYSLDGENKNITRTLRAEGEVSQEKLHLNISLKITSEIAGKWKLSQYWDEDKVHSVYIEIENPVIDTVKLPNLSWSRDPNPIVSKPVVVPVKDTPDEILPERIIKGFPAYLSHATLESAYNMTLQEINFREDGTLTVTYTDYRKPEPRLPVTTEESMIHYNIVGNQIWFSTNKEPIRCFPLNIRFADDILKINLDQNQLSSFTALSPCLKSFIRYLDDIHGMTLGYTSEESVQEFVDITLYDLIRTAESFEWGINLKHKTTEQ